MTYMNSNLVEPHIYGPDTLISINTNKPLPEGEVSLRKLPIFWCEACGLRVATPTQAIQHLSGRLHKVKIKNNSGDILPDADDATRKRVLDSTTTNAVTAVEPVPKKSKVQSEVYECKECNLVCNSALMKEQHINGKKHASTLAKLAAPVKPLVAPSVRTQFNYYCIPCKIRVKGSEQQIKQHYDGTEHKMNAGLEPVVKLEHALAGGGAGGGVVYGENRGRGHERGGMFSGRARGGARGGRGSVRGGRGSGGERGALTRGSFRGGSFSDQGRGWERGRWGVSRGHLRGRTSSRGGGVPIGGQYGSEPPYNATSLNFQQVGENDKIPRGNDYFATPTTKDNFIKAEPGSSNNYHSYSQTDKQHASTDNFYSNSENYYYNNSQQQSSSNGPFNSTSGPTSYSSDPPRSDYYSSQPPPVSKYTADNGNYYSNGYSNTNYSSDQYGNKQSTYDSFYQ